MRRELKQPKLQQTVSIPEETCFYCDYVDEDS